METSPLWGNAENGAPAVEVALDLPDAPEAAAAAASQPSFLL